MAVQKPIPITKTGLERLRKELQELVTVKRPATAERIHSIRELSPSTQGDGEYEDVKNEQAFIEGRIMTIEKILGNAEIIDPDAPHDTSTVHLGSRVSVTLPGGKTQTYTIIGAAEVDAAHGFVSNESPVGAALLGSRVGDTVEVNAPAGPIELKIKQIE